MTENSAKPLKRKRFTYVSVIVSISLVLFMLGLLGIILLQSKNIIKNIKENMAMHLFLTDNISKQQVDELTNKINALNVAKSIVYISKEQAAQEFALELGQDFVSFLGYNPLMPSIQVTLKADYTNQSKLLELENIFKQLQGVTDVSYQKNIYDQLNSNLKNISMVLLFLALVFTIISIVLINNTIRLNLFAKRFTIKSMQLVGATNWFIIKPFIYKSILNGFLGSIIAIVLLITLLNKAPDFIGDINYYYVVDEFIGLFAGLLLVGLTISILSSWYCTLKYLNTRIEDLY
ncbi:MAG: cell division protein FtsX [Bacteroidia bacterium]